MDDIALIASTKTPSVKFSADGHLELKGRSIPENSLDFYKPLLEWVDNYSRQATGETTIHVQLEYFNTSSSKCIMDLLKRVEKSQNDATVLWYYEEEDEDMLEAGEDYNAIIDIPFKLIATPG